MVLVFLRALFVLLMAAVAWSFVSTTSQPTAQYGYWSMAVVLAFATLLVVVDIFSPRKKLAVFSSVLGGLLVGISIAYATSFVIALLVDRYHLPPSIGFTAPHEAADFNQLHNSIIKFADLVVGVGCCYLAISFILQTQDDFRFVIPYVEFSKQTKGARPILLDTSVLIDGRIVDIALSGILESQLIVPRFVLDELQLVADSGDKLNRVRGRLGLDALNKLQSITTVDVMLYEGHGPLVSTSAEQPATDQRLIALAQELNGRVLTNDFNLNQVAQFRKVSVINLNALANAMKPVVKVGESLTVTIQKPGDLAGQGVGYLEDGTMVVVEQGRGCMNQDVQVIVTNTRQTAAGRMIFGKLMNGERR